MRPPLPRPGPRRPRLSASRPPNPAPPRPRVRQVVETDYQALLGRDLNTPVPASQSRPDSSWVQFQQRKLLPDQRPVADYLPALPSGSAVDVVVVGCGPAGLALAAALGNRGLSVGLVGPDSHLVNTYGVWCGAAAGPLPCAALRVS